MKPIHRFRDVQPHQVGLHGLMGVAAGSVILMQDSFTGVTIDVAKWTESDAANRISQNNALFFDAPHTDGAFTRYYVTSVTAVPTSGVIVVQVNLTWSDDGVQEATHSLKLCGADGTTNRVELSSRGNSGVYHILIQTGAVTRYTLDNGPAKGKDIKITYDIAATEIKCWYWDTGTSAWVQIGTTQTWDLGASLEARLEVADINTFSAADLGTMDNFYLSNADYTTQYPV